MMTDRRVRKRAPQVACIEGVFRMSRRNAPGLLEYRYDEIIDGRPLRPGELEGVLALLGGSGEPEGRSKDEARCAAAYVAMGLGLTKAVPAMKKALEGRIASPHVRHAFEFAVRCLETMQENGALPQEGEQLITLLRMRNSAEPAERRFAELVLEKADIKYGTVTGW
jgi:hypothetical protein